MIRLSVAQMLALAHQQKNGGVLTRLSGGLWVGDPSAWESGKMDAVSDYWVRGETVEALERRRLSLRSDSQDVIVTEITKAGRIWLANYHYERSER